MRVERRVDALLLLRTADDAIVPVHKKYVLRAMQNQPKLPRVLNVIVAFAPSLSSQPVVLVVVLTTHDKNNWRSTFSD
jgi:hypothetical protein